MDYAARLPERQSPPQHHHPSYNPYPAPPPQPQYLNQPQPQPQPQPQQPPTYPSASYYPNPNPHHAIPYFPHGSYSVGPAAGGGLGAGAGLAAYYYDRIGADLHGSAVKEAIRQYGPDPVGYVLVPPRPYNGLDLPAAPPHFEPPQYIAKPNYEGGTKKATKTTKVVQSAYCGVCKIDCNSPEVLNIHKQGKKHKKNLKKLQELITPKPQRAQETKELVENKVLVPDKGNGEGSKQTKRKEAPQEDLETKKRKILEEGAKPDEMKVCTICNVVVNSQKVYYSHIAGSKHAAMVKKQEEAAAS